MKGIILNMRRFNLNKILMQLIMILVSKLKIMYLDTFRQIKYLWLYFNKGKR